MIEQELILLGLLRQSPRHGYEIKLKVREILSLFAGVQLKSIYYPLRILEEKGLLAKQAVKKSNRPERFVYCLTDKGRHRFEILLNKNLLDCKRPEFTLDLSLYFLNFMKPVLARRRLKKRLEILEKISSGLVGMLNSKGLKDTLPLYRIMEHNLCLLEAEASFLSNLLKKI
ncbi:MAG: helix-turn-helix transcriptional regulator [Candidatus Omnitrophica bacterium]|jgi:DNA-binding PadR family transcriptional regulator|nr:helix-turn-helix transcriptional regulator [Candidatus Omnitrophota bacterium]MDD5660898.1 helix-turn-helix transcriptional regulator [Candidatus Omnitrophota bacterium]